MCQYQQMTTVNTGTDNFSVFSVHTTYFWFTDNI